MIILSGVLVVVAIALLGAAIVPGIISGDAGGAQVLGLDSLMVIYTSIAVSVVSALCLAIGVFLRRKELFGPRVSTAPAGKSPKRGRSRTKAERSAPASAGGGKAAPAQPAATDGPVNAPSPPPGDAVVFVVRGRRRYHLSTCRQLAGRDPEELTYAEAKEEGFTSCTACMPDTALAARAAVSVSAGTKGTSDALRKPAEGPGTAPLPEAVKTSELPATPDGSGRPPAPQAPSPSPSPTREEARPPGFRSDPLDTGSPFTGTSASVAGSGQAVSGPEAPAASDVRVRILSGTRRYHRSGCPLLEDAGENADDLESVTRDEAKARDCTPCLVCRPDHDPA